MNAGKTPDVARDPLLERYHEANALDTARPDPRLRETVLAHARAMAARPPDSEVNAHRTPANDSAWNWRLVASLATLGLVGLLVLQFERSPDEEREIAFGTGMTRSAEPEAAPPQAAAPAAALALEDAPLAAAPSEQTQPARAANAAPDTTSHPKATVPAQVHADGAASSESPPATDRFEAPAGGAQTASPAESTQPAPPAAPVMAAPLPEAVPAPSAKSAAPAPAERSADALNQSAEGRSRVAAVAPKPSASPLFAAIASGDRPQLEQLLRSGAAVDARDPQGQTALMAAARRGDRAMVQALLDVGASRTLRDRDGLSAADHARQSGHEQLLPLLE